MNVIVIGATGTIGRFVVAALIAQNHRVTAFARDLGVLSIESSKLRKVAGDVLDPKDVLEAVLGHDAVVIVLGAGKSRSGTVRSTGTTHVISAMQKHGIRRLICQSTLGAHESRKNLNFFWRRIMFGILLRPVLRDHELQETFVRASGLDWTIVRPAAFMDGPATGRFEEGFGPDQPGLALKIARAEVAGFLTRQLTDTRYLQKAVAIST